MIAKRTFTPPTVSMPDREQDPHTLDWKRQCHRWAWEAFGSHDDLRQGYQAAEMYYRRRCEVYYARRKLRGYAGSRSVFEIRSDDWKLSDIKDDRERELTEALHAAEGRHRVSYAFIHPGLRETVDAMIAEQVKASIEGAI